MCFTLKRQQEEYDSRLFSAVLCSFCVRLQRCYESLHSRVGSTLTPLSTSIHALMLTKCFLCLKLQKLLQKSSHLHRSVAGNHRSQRGDQKPATSQPCTLNKPVDMHSEHRGTSNATDSTSRKERATQASVCTITS